MPCAPHSVMFSVLTVNEQMIEKLELFSPHMQNNLSTSQTDERIQKQLISSFVLKHRPYKKIKAGVFSFSKMIFKIFQINHLYHLHQIGFLSLVRRLMMDS